jgi:chromosomal replication initiation ATPase DnaA
LKTRFDLAQIRFARFRDMRKRDPMARDPMARDPRRVKNIQREERANMALLTQRMLDHRVSCSICKNEVPAREIAIEAILSAVAEMFGLSVAELKGKNSTRAVALPRQIAMYLAKLVTDASLPEIGRDFGGKHHTTVAHSIAKIHEQRRADPNLASVLTTLLEAVPHGSQGLSARVPDDGN